MNVKTFAYETATFFADCMRYPEFNLQYCRSSAWKFIIIKALCMDWSAAVISKGFTNVLSYYQLNTLKLSVMHVHEIT